MPQNYGERCKDLLQLNRRVCLFAALLHPTIILIANAYVTLISLAGSEEATHRRERKVPARKMNVSATGCNSITSSAAFGSESTPPCPNLLAIISGFAYSKLGHIARTAANLAPGSKQAWISRPASSSSWRRSGMVNKCKWPPSQPWTFLQAVRFPRGPNQLAVTGSVPSNKLMRCLA